MDTTRMSSKGQVIIPKDLRDELGWQEGDELVVERQAEGVILKRKRPFKRTTLEEVVGIAGYKGPAISVEQMKSAVDEMFRTKGNRRR